MVMGLLMNEVIDALIGQMFALSLQTKTVSPSSNWNAADCDGDGVTNGQEITDGTIPTDGCSFTAANITLNRSSAWRDLDCDQDGVTTAKN